MEILNKRDDYVTGRLQCSIAQKHRKRSSWMRFMVRSRQCESESYSVATNDHNDEVAFKMIYASIPLGIFFLMLLSVSCGAVCSAHIYIAIIILILIALTVNWNVSSLNDLHCRVCIWVRDVHFFDEIRDFVLTDFDKFQNNC